MNDILANVLIQPKVVTGEGLKFLTDHMRNSHKEQMSVFDAEKSDETRERQSKIDLNARNVKCADLLPVFPQVKGLLDDIVKNVINPFYGFEVRDSEEPQLLCYEPGGHYKPHNDGEGLWTNPDGTQVWKKTIDRDVSTVLFLNDDFEGGYFSFPDLRIKIKPEPGLLVCFPSSRWFTHMVEPVTSGNRYTLVTWMRVKGFKTKDEVDKELADKYNIEVY
jgi:predicted 2-oxoglutarate/Fe(II)-dependent dioxygenase YbiX